MDRTEMESTAVALRLSGTSYAEIEARTGLSMEGAASAVERHLAASADTQGESAAVIDLARLDVLLKAVWELATQGQKDAVAQALTIMEQRATLLQHLGIARPDGSVSVSDRLAALKESAAPSAPVLGLVKEDDDGAG